MAGSNYCSTTFSDKRPKIATQPPESNSDDHSSFNNHGSMADSPSPCCGICLSDGGRAIRGLIDCCDHYFCFVCIMEWAKVESRCPMCKRRFSNILRLAKDGIFASDRVVDVPIRDQAYHPLGNITVGPSDPYAHVQCGVCLGTEYENYLLLCDLCDSAAHTYCMGLGTTVPEGDWFCHDCTVSRADHTALETSCDSQNIVPEDEANVSTSKIVQKNKNSPESQRSSARIFSQLKPNLQSFPVVPGTGSITSQINDRSVKTPQDFVDEVTGPGGRTLRRCRNVHSRIRELREKWNGFRNGSLNFTSSAFNSSGSDGQNIYGGRYRSGQRYFSSSSSCETLTPQNGVSSCTALRGHSDDIEKAWKMLDIAKSKMRDKERMIPVRRASKNSLQKSKEAIVSDSSHFLSTSNNSGIMDLGHKGMDIRHKSCSYGKQIDKLKSPNLDKQENRFCMNGTAASHDYRKEARKFKSANLDKQESRFCTNGIVASRDKGKQIENFNSANLDREKESRFYINGVIVSSDKGKQIDRSKSAESSNDLKSNCRPVDFEFSSSCILQMGIQNAGNKVKLQHKSFGASVTVPGEPHRSRLISMERSVSTASDSFCAKLKAISSLPSKVDNNKDKCWSMSHCEVKARKDDAKSEIQSLVKLNLKLLSRGQHLVSCLLTG